MDASTNTTHLGSFLIVIPGTVNYFYNLYARWMAGAFRRMGHEVHLHVLDEVPQRSYDFCILTNACEIEWANRFANPRDRLKALRRRCKTLLNFTADCVHTQWFRGNLAVARDLEVDGVLDIGFFPQKAPELAGDQIRYHFAFDGLLDEQARAADAFSAEEVANRTIPWAHVGVHNPKRIELTDQLISGFHPHGLIYLPEVAPIKEEGSPHLNHEQLGRVLKRTKYYVWFSQNKPFFMESLRFKMAWSSGCMPIQVVEDAAEIPDSVPFTPWLMREGEVVERLRALDFDEARLTFRQEFLRQPRFADGMAELLRAHGLRFQEDTGRSPLESHPEQVLQSCA